MLSAVRRYGVFHALRASAPRTPCPKSLPRLLSWQRPLTVSPLASRSLHISPTVPRFSDAAQAQAEEPTRDEEQITEFEELSNKGLVNREIIKNITNSGITTMTPVQSMTLPGIMSGGDVLAQAKTGTGKTLAFLVPVMQNVINDPTLERSRNRRQTSDQDIRAVIISPTRELAEQIAMEARKIASRTGVIVQTAVGGTRKREGLMNIQNQGCHVLIGTPGRLKDILSDPTSGVDLPKTTTFVLDEADRLLDDGFAPEIHEIQRYLPNPVKVPRQTLMFSATVPREVLGMVRQTMKPDFKFIKTVRDDEVPTHFSVPQKVVWLKGYENALPAVLEIAKNYNAEQERNPDLRPFKAIVYFSSTAEVQLAHEAFQKMLADPSRPGLGHPLGKRMRLFEMHGRLIQGKRTFQSNGFRNQRQGILFSSDVTARGMDFPDVTHVIQIRAPSDRDSYIHRLGRTARANKTGEGWILIHNIEKNQFNDTIGDLPIQTAELETATADMGSEYIAEETSPAAAESIDQVRDAMRYVPTGFKISAFKGMFGGLKPNIDKRAMLNAMQDMSTKGHGMNTPPEIDAALAQRLGLERILGYGGGSRGGFGGSRGSRGFRRDIPGRGFGGRGVDRAFQPPNRWNRY